MIPEARRNAEKYLLTKKNSFERMNKNILGTKM